MAFKLMFMLAILMCANKETNGVFRNERERAFHSVAKNVILQINGWCDDLAIEKLCKLASYVWEGPCGLDSLCKIAQHFKNKLDPKGPKEVCHFLQEQGCPFDPRYGTGRCQRSREITCDLLPKIQGRSANVSEDFEVDFEEYSILIDNVQNIFVDLKKECDDLEKKIYQSQIPEEYRESFRHYPILKSKLQTIADYRSGGKLIEDLFNHTNNDQHELKQLYDDIFNMLFVGDRESIYNIFPKTCDPDHFHFLVNIMTESFMLYNLAQSIKATNIEDAPHDFKVRLLLIENQYFKSCGCPSGTLKQRGSELTSMLSFAPPKMSRAEFYKSTILDRPKDHIIHYKMLLVYAIKRFDYNSFARSVFDSASIEDAKLIYELGMEKSLEDLIEDLELYKGTFFCEEESSRVKSEF